MAKTYRCKLITVPWELEVPTLGLASIAAVTPPQFEVTIVDLLRERLWLDEPVDLVGITASTPRIKAAYALADFYRSRGVRVVLGGHHATALPEEALEHADAVVCGEGEVAWAEICETFLSDPKKVQGIYRRRGPDLATLPLPRTDLMRMDRYGAFYYPIIASRGCPEACSFCFAKKMTHGWRTYPIRHVIEQVRRRPPWVKALYFVDDNLPGEHDYARELFRELKKLRVPFGMQARHEYADDPADLALAKEAGCVLISSGYESINQHSLDGVGKHATAEEYLVKIQRIFDAGIVPSGNWILGLDGDTPDTFARMAEFLDRSSLLHVSMTCEIPFPGTQAWKTYQREGRLLTTDYDEYVGKDHVIVRPTHMSAEELRLGIRGLARHFYHPKRAHARALKALRNPKIMDIGSTAVRAAGLLGLNWFQVWQWHYRMVPALHWLYLRLADANRFRYWRDLAEHSNFWRGKPWRAASGDGSFAYAPDAAWLDQEGWKPHRRARHEPSRGGPAPPPVSMREGADSSFAAVD